MFEEIRHCSPKLLLRSVYTVLHLNQISNGLPSFPLTAGASIDTPKPFFLACFPLKCQRNLIALLVFMPCTMAVETSYIIILHPSLVFKELKGFAFYLIHVFVTLVVVVQIHTTKWAERDEHRWCIKCKCIIAHRHNETNVRSLMSGSTQGGYVVILHHAVFCQAGRR